jgi:hypothetical protein
MSRRTFTCNNIQQNVMSQTPNLKNPIKPKKTHRAGLKKKKNPGFFQPWSGLYIQDRKESTGRLEHDSKDRSVRTGQPG